jgi:hypothetical protein
VFEPRLEEQPAQTGLGVIPEVHVGIRERFHCAVAQEMTRRPGLNVMGMANVP